MAVHIIRPVEYDLRQYDGDNGQDIVEWFDAKQLPVVVYWDNVFRMRNGKLQHGSDNPMTGGWIDIEPGTWVSLAEHPDAVANVQFTPSSVYAQRWSPAP